MLRSQIAAIIIAYTSDKVNFIIVTQVAIDRKRYCFLDAFSLSGVLLGGSSTGVSLKTSVNLHIETYPNTYNASGNLGYTGTREQKNRRG